LTQHSRPPHRFPDIQEAQVFLNRLSARLLSTVARVRPDERKDAGAAFLTLFGFMTGHALLETARDALFLGSLSARRLPWVYLAIALVALLLGQREPPFVRRFSTRNELTGWLIFSSVVTLAFWAVIGWAGPWVYYALYTWSGVLATLVVVRFWTLLAGLFTVIQAKRLFALIGVGSVGGAILGSALARILAVWLPARHLVLAGALVFLVSAAAPTLLSRGQVARSNLKGIARVWDMGRVGRTIWTGPYLRRVAGVILAATVTFTLVDFVFKLTVDRYVGPGEMGAFFSSVYLTLNVLSLLFQLLLVSVLLRKVGVTAALALVPGLILATAAGFALAGGLALVLLLKGADGSLRHSLYRTGTELLFVPISGELRSRVKGFIDVLGQRGGQALGSILILMLLSATTREGAFALLACGTGAVWLYLTLDLKKHYLDLFRETLGREVVATRRDFPALDMASLETLLATLNASDDRQVVAALEILAVEGKLGVVPALLLYHPSPAVVTQALELFAAAGRPDFLPLADRLLTHGDPGVRAAALRVLSALQPDSRVLREGLQDPAPEVRVTAAVGLLAAGEENGPLAGILDHASREESKEVRVALARAIKAHPAPMFDRILKELLREGEPEARLEAIRAIRESRNPAFLPSLVTLLSARSLREEVRATLVSFGPQGLARLEDALKDPALPHGVRRQLPQTIGGFGSGQAAGILLTHLLTERDGMIRFKILRALGRWRNDQPHLPLDTAILEQSLHQTLSAGFRFMNWRRALEAGAREISPRGAENHELLVLLLRDKQDHALERLFRLLNLYAANDEFRGIFRGLHSPRRESRASSRELLEHLLFSPLRRPMLTLVDDLLEPPESFFPDEEGWEHHAPYPTVLGELLDSGVESLSSLAAVQIGALGVVELGLRLRRCEPLSEAHLEVLRDARLELGLPAEGG
jgi:ATP/ADP translocase/HEAT repeat protein